MKADQRNSGTQRNRRLAKMRKEVERELEIMTMRAAVTRQSDDIREAGRLALVLDKLTAIRQDLEAQAPARWRELYDKTPSDAVWQRGVSVMRVESRKATEARERREAQEKAIRDKTNEALRLLGL